jgi:hypothetical protein
MSPLSPQKAWLDDVEESERLATLTKLPAMRPNRRRGEDVEMGGIAGLTETNLLKHNSRMSNVNPMVHNFISPIGMFYTRRVSDFLTSALQISHMPTLHKLTSSTRTMHGSPLLVHEYVIVCVPFLQNMYTR